MRAWHFIRSDNGRHTLRDGTTAPPDGETLRFTGPLIICNRGLHASMSVLDALQYAPGEILCRVECGGEILHQSDKLVCSERTILARTDVSEALWAFARQCALDAAHLWKMPEIVRLYLETGDESLRDAAWDAAWAAARDAAGDAAGVAARAAAWVAARAAAWDAAGVAARAAAWDAAEAAAWAAAWAAAEAAAWAAAEAAAEAAAGATAWGKQLTVLSTLLLPLFPEETRGD